MSGTKKQEKKETFKVDKKEFDELMKKILQVQPLPKKKDKKPSKSKNK